MDYVGHIIRPPSEANSLILQVTVGCSHNKCTFCGAYKEKTFAIKDLSIIENDLEFAAAYCKNAHKRVFLADGDALIIPFQKLSRLFKLIRNKLPHARRISLYATAKAIRSKSIEELQSLKKLGLDRIYLGLESGSNKILEEIRKGETSESMISAASRVKSAGLFLSVTVLLGLGQKKHSQDHALQTASTLNKMEPNQIGILTLIPLDNTVLGQNVSDGIFTLPNPYDLLRELRSMVYSLNCTCQMHSNHASNYVPIAGRLPKDKKRLLQEIDDALCGTRKLVPEQLRSL